MFLVLNNNMLGNEHFVVSLHFVQPFNGKYSYVFIFILSVTFSNDSILCIQKSIDEYKLFAALLHMLRIMTDIFPVQRANARKASTLYCGLLYEGNDRCTDMRYEILFTLLGMQNYRYRLWCISGIMSTVSVHTLYKSNEANIHWWFNICHVCSNLCNSIYKIRLSRRRRSNEETMGENRSYSNDHNEKKKR